MSKSIAVLTAGGDCPGINAVIRAVAKTAINDHGLEVVGIEDGFLGLIEGRWRKISYTDVSGIIALGGTILGTSNKGDPFRYRSGAEGQFEDVSDRALANFERTGAAALVAIGGDGTLKICEALARKGLPIVGVPKTIDNDVDCTDYTFGFDSGVATAAEAIDKLHTTAQSHHRVMVIEVMGRYAGWLALYSGVAGGGDVILIPEISFDTGAIAKRLLERSRRGKRFSIVVVAEGARTEGGDLVVSRRVEDSTDSIRLGGIAEVLGAELQRLTKLETRVTVLGHLQRGGGPTAFDRVLATRFGREACALAVAGRKGLMVALKCQDITTVSLADATARLKVVPAGHPLVAVARSVGTSFGD
ncbi:MAG: ATP-dependent 6-phosphofructokinase [bacterium]